MMSSSDRYEPYDFANRRHIGPAPEEMAEMLRVVGASSLDALISETVPEAIRQATPLDFGRPLSERGVLDRMRATANKNRVLTSLIGQGYHGTIMPPAIQRNILENPAWYTAYTPYQAEISQGRLEALLNFQTLVSDLTALDVANASLLDEATAAAEAMALARRVTKSKATAFFIDEECLPQTIAVLKTRAEPLGRRIVVGDPFKDLEAEKVFGALFHCRRPPGTHASEAAGRNGGGYCSRLHAAVRNAHGLRRTARRLYRREGPVQTRSARPYRRRFD
jgi:glycine dehydrogenase